MTGFSTFNYDNWKLTKPETTEDPTIDENEAYDSWKDAEAMRYFDEL